MLGLHQRQGLMLGLKSDDHAPRVHAQLDDLQSDPPPYGHLLLGQVNHTAAAFPNLLQEPVSVDGGAKRVENRRSEIP